MGEGRRGGDGGGEERKRWGRGGEEEMGEGIEEMELG